MCVYSGYKITSDTAGFWSFDNETARNVIIFGVDNSSSFGSPEKKLSINSSKANAKVYVMDLVLLSLEKYLTMEMGMVFQLITILLINRAH